MVGTFVWKKRKKEKKGDIQMCIYNTYDMKIRILASHLMYITCRGLSHENGNLNFICHLTGISIMCMFLTSKMAFEGHDTHHFFH